MQQQELLRSHSMDRWSVPLHVPLAPMARIAAMTGHDREHVHDPADFADSRVLLGDHEAVVIELCWCGNPLPCLGELEPMPERVRRQRRTGYGWQTRV